MFPAPYRLLFGGAGCCGRVLSTAIGRRGVGGGDPSNELLSFSWHVLITAKVGRLKSGHRQLFFST